ncbi:hypothetical protein GCM10018952_44080 [Streptosporangium vulgare]
MPEWPALPPIPSWVPDVVAAIAIGFGVIASIALPVLLYFLGRTLFRKAKVSTAKTTGADLLTWLAASIATIVSAQGMWQFLDRIIGDVHWSLRGLMFAFIEVAVVISAVRARKNMRENFSAGIDGVAVWALTGLSAVLSAMEAASLPEAVFRLAAPLVAAWLWERGMAIERHRATGRKRIHWRFTLERVLVYIGLAEAQDRTAEEVDAQRRLTKVSLAAKKARRLRDAGASDRKQRAALAKLDTAFERAAEHAGLARDPEVQKRVRAETASLYSAAGLLDITPASEWMTAAVEAPSDFARLADRTEQLRADLVNQDELRAMEANILMVVSSLTGQRLTPVQDASKAASTSATTSTIAIPTPQRRILISPGDPRPVGTLAPFVTWTRPEARPLRGDLLLPPLDAILDANLDADSDAGDDRTRPPGDQFGDQKEPTEQDKGRIARYWAKRVEKGEVLSKWALADKTKFKPTWCGDRITEGKQILAAKGWTFDDRGRPVGPAEVDAELVASTPSVNGSSPSTSN